MLGKHAHDVSGVVGIIIHFAVHCTVLDSLGKRVMNNCAFHQRTQSVLLQLFRQPGYMNIIPVTEQGTSVSQVDFDVSEIPKMATPQGPSSALSYL